MARLSVTWGEPRRVVTYPAAPEELSKLLGLGVSGLGDLAGDARQDHRLAGAFSASAEIAGGPLVTQIFELSAALTAAVNFAPDAQQSHLPSAVLDAGAAASVSLVQDQFFAAALQASGDVAGAVEETHALGAEIGVTGDVTGLIELSFDIGAQIGVTASLAGDIEQGTQFLLESEIASVADLAASAIQEHELALNVFALSAVDLPALELTVELGAEIGAAGDMAVEMDSSPAGAPMEAAVAAYTGNGSTQSVTGVGFQPDMIVFIRTLEFQGSECWVADRPSSGTGRLWRGNNSDPVNGDDTILDADSVTSFDADGFTLGSSSRVNGSSQFMAAICFKMGDQFEIIDKANDGAASQTIAHSLTTAPVYAWCKQRARDTGEWIEGWTPGAQATNQMGEQVESDTDAVLSVSATEIELGDDIRWNPTPGGVYEASAPLFLWGSENAAGVYHTGEYEGTGATGNAVTGLGFQPSILMVRNVDGAGIFFWTDDGGGLSPSGEFIRVDTEARGSGVSVQSDGFTLGTGDANVSGETYRYFAWA